MLWELAAGPSMDRPLRVLDLFSSLNGRGDPFREAGHEVFAVDVDRKFSADAYLDIGDVAAVLDAAPWQPDVIFASPAYLVSRRRPTPTFATVTPSPRSLRPVLVAPYPIVATPSQPASRAANHQRAWPLSRQFSECEWAQSMAGSGHSPGWPRHQDRHHGHPSSGTPS
jgi:hypothetical protein